MNLIVNGFHKPEYFEIVQAVCKTISPEISHVIYEDTRVKLSPDIATRYYACAILSHKYHYEATGNLLPLDAKLLTELCDCEAVCLQMMDRDEIVSALSYDERKHIYLTHLRYWHHVIKTDNIKLFLTSNIPHVVYDFIIYSLCKLFKIQTILFYQFQPGLSFIMEDWKQPTPNLRERMKALLHGHRHESKFDLDIPARLQRELETDPETSQVIPFYMLNTAKAEKPTLSSIIQSLLAKAQTKLRSFRRIPNFLARSPFIIFREIRSFQERRKAWQKINILVKHYEDLCVEPDLTIDYVYLPLHLQPELSTAPMAGVYVNQILIAEMLNYFLPENTLIYIKEHPNQNLEKRDLEFYPQILRCPKVRLISRNFASRRLISGAKAVATCTGTAGWEAWLSSKPVLLFGYTFYQDAPGIFKIRMNSDCESAITSIWSQHTPPSDEAMKAFLHLLSKHAVYADIDPEYMNSRQANWQENSSAIFTAVKRFLPQFQ